MVHDTRIWQGGGLGNTPLPRRGPGARLQQRSVVPGPPEQPAVVSRPPSSPSGGQAESSPWSRAAGRPRRRPSPRRTGFPRRNEPLRGRAILAASVTAV